MSLRSVAEQLVLLLGIFLASGVQNALSAIYLTTANRRFFARAATIGMIMTAVNLLCWKTLLTEEALNSSTPAFISYLAGDWVGSFIGLKRGAGPPPAVMPPSSDPPSR